MSSSVFAQYKIDSYRFGSERPKIGLVLSGGGAKGIAHVGVLKTLEELNIPIDYIGGTSMGAVVGGLYAMGYTAAQLDTIMRETDWARLFNDAPNREYVGVTEKINNDPYMLRLSYKDGEISTLTRGAIGGQNIDNMLNHYLFEAYKSTSFSDLKIPFFCVGTDLITGEYVILEKGNLAQAIRASMAVPTVFAPIEIDGRLLADGGLINNFPVLETRKRGMDIIIGVDAGYQYKDKEELKGLANVLEQVIFMNGQNLNGENLSDCDILVHPDVEKISALAFSRADKILEKGYAAADSARPELQHLSDLLNEKYKLPIVEKKLYIPEEKIRIDTIVLHGNHRYSRQYVLQRLQIKTQILVSVEEVEESIQRLFGSLSFTKVTCHFEFSNRDTSSVILHIDLIEAPMNEIKIGVRYDNIRKPALLLGFTAKNVLLPQSELNLDIDLSTFATAKARYSVSPRLKRRKTERYSIWKPSFFVSYMYSMTEMFDYNVSSDSLRIMREMEYAIHGHRASIGAEISMKNNLWGTGLFYDHTYSREHVGGDGQILTSQYWYPQIYYLHNSFDRKNYPQKGAFVEARGRALFSTDREVEGKPLVRKFGTYYLDARYAIPLSPRTTFYPGLSVAGTFVFNKEDQVQNHISQQQKFYHGGLFQLPYVNHTPFVGLFFMQQNGLYAVSTQFNLQHEILKDLYLSARLGALKIEDDITQMNNFKHITIGAGVSASYNTSVGPIGITIHGANQSSVGVFVNFGFWF